MIIHNNKFFAVFHSYLSLIEKINVIHYTDIFASENWCDDVKLQKQKINIKNNDMI